MSIKKTNLSQKESNQITLPIFGTEREFEILEIKSNPNKSWFWQLKIKFEDYFKEFYPTYNIHFAISTTPYKGKISSIEYEIEEGQLSMERTIEDMEAEIQNTIQKYRDNQERFGLHTFEKVRLKEYKESDGTDTLTFLVGNDFVDFFNENVGELKSLSIIINSSEDERYNDLDL